MCPMLIIYALTLNTEMIKLCFHSFTTILLLFYAFVGSLCLSLSFFDARAIFGPILFWCMMTATFSDALPNYFRIYTAKFTHLLSLFYIICMIIFVYFDIFPELTRHTIKIGKFETHSTTQLANTCFINYIFFSMRMVYSAWFHPERFALIKSSVFTCKTTQKLKTFKRRLTFVKKKQTQKLKS